MAIHLPVVLQKSLDNVYFYAYCKGTSKLEDVL